MMMMMMIWLIRGIFHTACPTFLCQISHFALVLFFFAQSLSSFPWTQPRTYWNTSPKTESQKIHHRISYLLVFTAIRIASPWPLDQPLFLVGFVKGVSAGRRFNQLLPSQPLPATHRRTNKKLSIYSIPWTPARLMARLPFQMYQLPILWLVNLPPTTYPLPEIRL